MTIIPWIFLMLVVVLNTVGQLSLKYAFSTPGEQPNKSILSLLFSPFFWLWFVCYIVVFILWLIVLRIMPLSQAFPALGLTFALVPLASYFLLKEKVIFSQWLGIIIIVVGAIFVVQT
jgi:undecaprenyl phosphate-alpha-L-ara4N flippase subunit ArnE